MIRKWLLKKVLPEYGVSSSFCDFTTDISFLFEHGDIVNLNHKDEFVKGYVVHVDPSTIQTLKLNQIGKFIIWLQWNKI